MYSIIYINRMANGVSRFVWCCAVPVVGLEFFVGARARDRAVRAVASKTRFAMHACVLRYLELAHGSMAARTGGSPCSCALGGREVALALPLEVEMENARDSQERNANGERGTATSQSAAGRGGGCNQPTTTSQARLAHGERSPPPALAPC